jgi:hydroxyquinol 1,2-dioxygenase
MENLDERSITDAVLQSHAGTPDSRTKELVDSLVTHLHAFAREVSLTEDEWLTSIRFLTAVGHKTDDRRQEFILLSDTLGLSSLVTAMSNRNPKGCTESTALGPFFLTDAPAVPNGGDVAQGAPGELCFVSGSVRGVHGEPVAGARIEVWQADEDGMYDVQYENLTALRERAVLLSELDGSFEFTTVVPRPYPMPNDGPVGDMLKTLGRRSVRPAHLHFMISAQAYEPLITQIFRKDDPDLRSDAAFGVRSSLVCEWTTHPAGIAPDGSERETPFTTIAFDFVLAPVRI